MQPLAHVAVVIPVRNSQRTIGACVESMLEQDCPGLQSIFIVGNSDDQDTTWKALEHLEDRSKVHCIKVSRPASWSGRDANWKRFVGCEAATNAGADIIALADSQIFAPRTWLSSSLELMQKHNVDSVAGISRRHPHDHSLSGLYQDGSLFSEWPRYGKTFFFSKKTIGKARGFPITASLLISREVFESVRGRWPINCTYDWDDFRLAWEIVLKGFTILCTDTICVYRNHKRRFRWVKQISAGAGALLFHRDNPHCGYTKQLMVKAILFTVCLAGTLLVSITSFATAGLAELSVLLSVVCLGLAPFSILSVIKARDLRALLFPLLDVTHIGLWVVGVVYTLLNKGNMSPAISDLLVKLRQ
ncbi:MAG: glycosyltransferase family 2 protein [Ktedonobacteraceae bacterium]|nr:glycosyltransferase family 2 protein [Ktedonobacteraceae bacterium]MBV8822777.1 glycosyltransferase family 2 protein [Ktedonobacteraceae bacterium]MBV9020864.1 glycosyltransferase family 2 protein [Ktedonobacteraceae bacterium]